MRTPGDLLRSAKNRVVLAQGQRLTPWWDAMVNGLIGSTAFPHRLRPRALWPFGLHIHPDAIIEPGVRFKGPKIHVGARSGIRDRCLLERGTSVGRDTQLAPGTTLLTYSHHIGPGGARAGEAIVDPSTVGDGCWLGANVTVLPGVHIADGCVIGAGAVVTKDCLPHGLYVGVPARRLRDLPPRSEGAS